MAAAAASPSPARTAARTASWAGTESDHSSALCTIWSRTRSPASITTSMLVSSSLWAAASSAR